MENIGEIVKRLDEAGRVLIPAGIRKALCLQEGDFLQFSIHNDSIILKGYQETKYKDLLLNCIKSYDKVYKHTLLITNQHDKRLSSYGNALVHKAVFTEELQQLLKKGNIYLRESVDDHLIKYSEENVAICVDAVLPIHVNNKKVGSLILLGVSDCCTNMGEKLQGMKLIATIITEYLLMERSRQCKE